MKKLIKNWIAALVTIPKEDRPIVNPDTGVVTVNQVRS
jgi:hypothetical protein